MFGGLFGTKDSTDRAYRFTMVISPNSDPNADVDELNGEFTLDSGETIDDARQAIIDQYRKENRYARNLLVVSFNYR